MTKTNLEASDALSILCQQDSPEPSVVVIRRCTNTFTFPCKPLGSSTLMSGLSLGVLLPLSSLWTAYAYKGYFHTLKNERLLPHRGGMGYKVYPYTQEVLWKALKKGTGSLNQCHYQFLVCSPSPYRRRHTNQGRIRLQWVRLQPSPSMIAGL